MELYIHIPFCVRKCRYCDFLSFASDACVREKYVDQLIREIESIPEEDAGQCPENAAPPKSWQGGRWRRSLSAAERRLCFRHWRLSEFWQPSGRSFG
ncbi:MAG: hypothetical protein ACLS5Z_11740 [Clostridium fessum]